MKKILFVLFLMPLFAFAQKNKEIKPVKMHTVGPKESLSSIGRMYEVNGRVLANYNNLEYEKGINIGQVLKIPPKGTTLDQVPTPPKPVTETIKKEEIKTQPVAVKEEKKPVEKSEPNTGQGTPIYHKVGKKETLYRISTLYQGTSIDDLKKWNNLTGDVVTEGADLIVGYKKTTAETKMAPVEKADKEKPAVTETVKKEPEKKTKEPERTEPAKTDVPGKAIKGGAFKSLYELQNGAGSTINEEGALGVFKSTSGWKDGKYYCLYNNAVPGTIIRVSTATGKYVYAKVLDLVPDLKQNNGLLILISNAAADELGLGDNTGNCSISYSK